ncbi:hypothetical protein BJF89_10245 [Corynebacterium sp. CNJ-954]|nr:hypothetical protein BJF89_10245 [Corynebacterium sp. CNJ-954]
MVRVKVQDCTLESDDSRGILTLSHNLLAGSKEKRRLSPVELPYAAVEGYFSKGTMARVFILQIGPMDVAHPGPKYSIHDLYSFTASGQHAGKVRDILDNVIEAGREMTLPEGWEPVPQLQAGVDIASRKGDKGFDLQLERAKSEEALHKKESKKEQREKNLEESRQRTKESLAKAKQETADARKDIKRAHSDLFRQGAGLARLPDDLSSKDVVVEFGDIFVTADSIWYDGEIYPRSGAKATIDTGAAARNRVSGGRVLGGALLFGAAGAIVGSSAKKDEGLLFMTVELPDGGSMITSASARKHQEATRFVREVNRRARD